MKEEHQAHQYLKVKEKLFYHHKPRSGVALQHLCYLYSRPEKHQMQRSYVEEERLNEFVCYLYA